MSDILLHSLLKKDSEFLFEIKELGKQIDDLGKNCPNITRHDFRKKIAEAVENQLHQITYANKIFIYDENRFKYIPDSSHIETIVCQILEECKQVIDQQAVIAESLRRAKLRNYTNNFPFNPDSTLLNCKNGVVKLKEDGTFELLPHDHKYLFNYCLETGFDGTLKDSVVLEIEKYFKDWGNRDFIIDIGALAICQLLEKSTFKTAFLMEGPGDSGKTTIMEFLGKVFGVDSYSKIDLGALMTNQFSSFALEGKILNLADEIHDFDPRSALAFKRLTGGVDQQIEEKYETQRNSKITTVHVFACNDLPDVSKIDDYAFYKRWKIAEFKNKFPRNPEIAKELQQERNCEEYLYLCLKRAWEILKTGWEELDPDKTEELWKSRSLNSDRYLFEDIRPADHDVKIQLAAIHTRYTKWCKMQEGHVPTVSDRHLSARLTRLGYSKRKINGNMVFVGIAFNQDQPDWLKKYNERDVGQQDLLSGQHRAFFQAGALERAMGVFMAALVLLHLIGM